MRGSSYVREAKPLFDSPYSGVVIERVLEGRSPMIKKIHSYHNYLPLPLINGKGIKGIGLITIFCYKLYM